MTNNEDFTQAAEDAADRTGQVFIGNNDAAYGYNSGFTAGAEWARAYLTERCPACGEDPAGPLRPLTTDERSYRYAQDLGYELPEEPR